MFSFEHVHKIFFNLIDLYYVSIIGGGFLEGDRVHGPPPQRLQGRVYPGRHRRNPAEPG